MYKYIVDNETTLGVIRNLDGWMESIYHINIEGDIVEIFSIVPISEYNIKSNDLIYMGRVLLE